MDSVRKSCLARHSEPTYLAADLTFAKNNAHTHIAISSFQSRVKRDNVFGRHLLKNDASFVPIQYFIIEDIT